MNVNYTPVIFWESYHAFHATCGTSMGIDGSSSATIPSFDSCQQPTFPLLVTAQIPGMDPAFQQYVLVPDATYSPGGTITVPDDWAPMPLFTATMQGMPDGNTYPSNVSRWSLVIGVPIGRTASSIGQDEDPTSETFTTSYPPGLGVGTYARMPVNYAFGGSAMHDLVTHSFPTSITVDYPALEVPWVDDADSTATGVSWSQGGSGTPDARLVYWRGEWQDASVAVQVVWSVLDDGLSGTSIDLPHLPASYASVDPYGATSTYAPQPRVYYVAYDNLNGYDESRPLGEMLIDPIGALGAFPLVDFQRRISSSNLMTPPWLRSVSPFLAELLDGTSTNW
jgi:hypothetical protein